MQWLNEIMSERIVRQLPYLYIFEAKPNSWHAMFLLDWMNIKIDPFWYTPVTRIQWNNISALKIKMYRDIGLFRSSQLPLHFIKWSLNIQTLSIVMACQKKWSLNIFIYRRSYWIKSSSSSSSSSSSIFTCFSDPNVLHTEQRSYK